MGTDHSWYSLYARPGLPAATPTALIVCPHAKPRVLKLCRFDGLPSSAFNTYVLAGTPTGNLYACLLDTLVVVQLATRLMRYTLPCITCHGDTDARHDIVQSPTRVISQTQSSIPQWLCQCLRLDLAYCCMQF